jgi:uncharacterized protein YgiM (DUF1202 family)
MKHNEPHFELAHIYQDGNQETERIELYHIEDVIHKGSHLKMARRGFVGLAALSTGALLAACGAATSTSSPPSTPTPTNTPIPTPTNTPAPTPSPIVTGQASYSSSPELEVHLGPGDEYDVSFTLPNGTSFTITARDSSSNWADISTDDGRLGWAPVSDITITSSLSLDSLPVPGGVISGSGQIAASIGPGMDASFTIDGGTQVTITARDSSSSWAAISTPDGQHGWVPVSDITMISSVSLDSLPVSSETFSAPSQPAPPPPAQPAPAPPQPAPPPAPAPPPPGGGKNCTCNEICTCVPIWV